MKRKAMSSTVLVAIIVCIGLWPATTPAEDVILNPGYITGQVSVGTEDYKVRNLSVSANGGGYSASKGVSQDYREPIVPLDYSLTVQGGEWATTVNATATASPAGSYYPYTNIYFSPRALTVPATDPPTTVGGNDYTTDATVQFQLRFTVDSDPFTSWNANGYAVKTGSSVPEQTNSRSYAYSSYCSDGTSCSWDMPVVANSKDSENPNDTGVRIYAYVRVYGTHPDGTGYNKTYYFWWYSPDYLYQDIAPGDTLEIPLEINHTAPDNQEFGTGSVQGMVNLGLAVDGIDYVDRFIRDYVYGYGSVNVDSNPGDYLLANERTGPRVYRVRTYLNDRTSESDPWRSMYLYWPYTDGDPQNDQITVEANQSYTKDFSQVTGILTGQIKFTGTLRNSDLNYYQLRAYGACDYYVANPEGGYHYDRQPTCGGYSYETVYGSDVDQSYRFFLTPGPWHPYYLQTYAYGDMLEYLNYSQMRIYDYSYYYDGRPWSYDLGTPSQVVAGLTTIEDRSYCTGSVLVRFRVAGDVGRVGNPYVSGSANIYNADGKRELSTSIWGYSYPPTTVTAPEVEVHGVPGDYNLSTVRAQTDDGTQVTFPSIPVELECGVRKGRDLTGPEIVITHPSAELHTNESPVAVVGTASDDTGIGGIDVNGNTVVFAPTDNPDTPNEVAFSYNLAVTSGINTVTTTAVDLAGNESFDSRDIYVDLWMPTVTINSPGNGAVSGPQANVPISVQGADQGYGFSLRLSFDGEVIHEAAGTANDTAASSLSFSETRSLGVGAHTITAEVSDVAGNSTTESVTIRVNDPPVLSIDLSTQSVQYGDRISTVTITADDSDTPPSDLEMTWSELPDSLVASGGCTASGEGSSCSWTLDGQVLESPRPDSYEISLNVDDGVGLRSIGTELVVTIEDASATFDDSNPVSVQVAAPGGASGPFTLIVRVSESQPDEPTERAGAGDIANAEVSVSLVPVGPGSTINPSCSSTTSGNVQTTTCDFGGVPVNTYTVAVAINGGGYYAGSAEDVLTVYDPSLGFTTGGGWFNWPGTGEKTNFGYTMKYGKNGKNVKGNLLLIRHLADGQKYRIKSNAISGLAIGENLQVPYGWASFSGKSTYLDPEMLDAEGNHGFTVYVEDRNEPGSGNDRFWITTRAKDGSTILVMSLDEDAPDNAVAIQGGNIVAPH